MKFMMAVALLIVLSVQVSAQDLSTKEGYILFDSTFKHTDTPEHAVYMGILKKDSDTGWQWSIYNIVGPLVSTSHFKDAELKILHGRQLFYHTSGYVDSAGSMINNREQGDWLYYDDTGKVLLRKTYDQGKLLSTTNLSSDTLKKEKIYEDEKESEFPGGIQRWIYYLEKNMKYPDRAMKADITGTVIALFDVATSGEIGTVEIFKSVEFSLDEETLRILKRSPKWNPGWQNGKPVKTYKKQPLVYRFS